MSKLSILIVNYRSERQLAICLASLADCCIDLDYEIQIINNDQIIHVKKDFYFSMQSLPF